MNLILTSREAVILSIVQNKSCRATQIHEEYERQTGDKMPQGSLYTTLKRMSDKNIIKFTQKQRYRVYNVTARGGHLLTAFLSQSDRIISSCRIRPKAV